jgi:NAD(P)-dependent dehydrogenase (short-subunit alcohol dehydrogenase family)
VTCARRRSEPREQAAQVVQGDVDILVNNAGVYPFQPTLQQDVKRSSTSSTPTSGDRSSSLPPSQRRWWSRDPAASVLERGAGDRAGHPDDEYLAAGARTGSRSEAFDRDVELQVRIRSIN